MVILIKGSLQESGRNSGAIWHRRFVYVNGSAITEMMRSNRHELIRYGIAHTEQCMICAEIYQPGTLADGQLA